VSIRHPVLRHRGSSGCRRAYLHGKIDCGGTRAEFYTAAGQKHGFFNDRPGTPWHAVVVRQTDLFLRSLGYLKGDPTIAIPDPKADLEKRRP